MQKLKIPCTILVLILSTFTLAQEVKMYTEELEGKNGQTGTARYFYKAGKNGQVILHGQYQADFVKKDSANVLSFYKESQKGNYQDGARTGSWVFTNYDHKLQVTDIVDFKVEYNLSSTLSRLKGAYLNGVPDGEWSFENSANAPGNPTFRSSTSLFRFKDGALFGSFALTSAHDQSDFSVSGNVAEDGLLDGLWTFSYLKDSIAVREVRSYQKGFLLWVLQTDTISKDTLNYVLFEDVKTKLDLQQEGGMISIASGNHGLAFDQGYATESNELLVQQEANNHLDGILQRIGAIDTVLLTGGFLKLGTARFEYQATEKQQKEIKLIHFQFDSLRGVVRRVLRKHLLEVNNQKTDSLAWVYQYFAKQQESLRKASPLIDLMSSEDFRLVNPTIYLENSQSYFPAQVKIGYIHDGESRTMDIGYRTNAFETFAQLLDRLHEEVVLASKLETYVTQQVKEILQSGQLESLENEIIVKRARIDSLYTLTYSNPDVRQALKSIYGNFIPLKFEELKQTYATAASFSERADKGLELIDFLDILESMPEEVTHIYESRKRIEEAYTIVRFDPYTFNHEFKTIQKRRLYEKTAGLLFEHLVTLLKEEKNPTELPGRTNDILLLQRRILELLDEDTARLERKIKNIKSPEQVKQLLEL